MNLVKFCKLRISIFICIVFLCIASFLTDWLAGSLLLTEPHVLRLSAPLRMVRNPKVEIAQDIIDNLSNIRELSLQRGISGVPVISNLKFFEILSIKPSPNNPLLISLDARGFLQRIVANKEMYAFGGIILFSSNLAKLKNKNELKVYIEKLREQFKFDIYVEIVGDHQKYKVTIEPLISADCDLSYKSIEYCRYPFSRPAPDNRASWLDTIADFRGVGFDSMMGPRVDLSALENGDQMASFAKDIALLEHNKGLLTVLKHFGYDPNILNTHNESKLLAYDGERFREILKPYIAVEQLNINYGIMLTHHSLNIDQNIPLPFSVKIKNYIDRNFPNSVTISDEIKMDGLSHNKDLYEVTRDLQTDMFIFHSGNVKFNVSPIVSSLKSSYEHSQAKSVRKILMLKHKQGLLSIEKI